MGVKSLVKRVAAKGADRIAKLSVLSPEQLETMNKNREAYLSEQPDPEDTTAEELTSRLLAASSVEIYNAYLPQLHEFYVPVDHTMEYGDAFRPANNIRYFNITKWVTDKRENSLEKLVNVYAVLANEDCNIALVFNRTCTATEVYLAVANLKNDDSNVDAENYRSRLEDAIRGNFPGAEWKRGNGVGTLPCLNNSKKYSVATASNVPAEKSEKFVSQTIEKLLDGIIPDSRYREYTIILLATPIRDVAERKFRLAEFYTALAPYNAWQKQFTFNENMGSSSMAEFGVNVGASAGVQNGVNQSKTQTTGETDSKSDTVTDSDSQAATDTKGNSVTDSNSQSETDSISSTDSTALGQTESQSNTQTKGRNSSYTDTNSKTDTASSNTTNTRGYSTNESETDNISTTIGVNGSVEIPKVLELGANISTTTGHSSTAGTGTSASNAFSEGTSTAQSVSNAASYGTNISNAATSGTAQSLTKSTAETTASALAQSTSRAVANSTSRAVSNTVGHSVAQTLGRAVSKSVSSTAGTYKGINLGTNFGANFARSSTVSVSVGKSEGITQSFTNYTIKRTLEILEEQMKRLEESDALGMWDFAAYVLSEDMNVASNVAHSYLALTQGEKSYVSNTAVNLWRGDMGDDSQDAWEISSYLRDLRHPVFGLNPNITKELPFMNVYPATVTAATSLSGKELAYSLNFPQRSVSGLPVMECAEFGRNIVTYDGARSAQAQLELGQVFHMNHTEAIPVSLAKQSLASHTFITGSTGSGKSNTVYQLLEEALDQELSFLVIEPAKGEYKHVFGTQSDVAVYGTNPALSQLLRINPFSFPDGVHVFEHLDRLTELFNVCWPMYAAMPAVLKNAMEKSYEDCGWNLTASTNEFGTDLYPTFADVARNIRTIIDNSEYDAENKGAYKGSLLTRLQSLTNGINGMLFTSEELTAEELFDRNVVIDLSRVGSSETKSLIMGMLVLKLQEHRMSSSTGMNVPLKHITVLEEAHNLLKKTSSEQPAEGANLQGKSVEMIANAIAEMRTYGEGFVIVDQAPGLLDMAAIRNTNTKIIMRLPDQSDRELVGKAANLSDDQITELAKLPCGVAAVYQNEWVQPVLCKVARYEDRGRVWTYRRETVEAGPDATAVESCIMIADLISKGVALDRELVLTDIRDTLLKRGVSAVNQVAIMRMLIRPPKQLRMTKLAPIVDALFPEVTDSVKNAYSENNDPEIWTEEAEAALKQLVGFVPDDQTRRDIIQGIMTHYLLNVEGNMNALENWSKRGGLR